MWFSTMCMWVCPHEIQSTATARRKRKSLIGQGFDNDYRRELPRPRVLRAEGRRFRAPRDSDSVTLVTTDEIVQPLRPKAATMPLPRFDSVNARCKKESSGRSLDARRYPLPTNWVTYRWEFDLNLSPSLLDLSDA